MNRNEVIRILEKCAKEPLRRNADKCVVTLDVRFVNSILELLKEQEAVKPVPPEDEFGLYRCGKCHHQLFRCVDKYCSRCGRKVKDAGFEADVSILKEQEPKPVGLYGKDDWYGLVCVCPDCKAEWMSDKSDTHFCPNCGQEVKWNE